MKHDLNRKLDIDEEDHPTIRTLGELREHLSDMPDDTEIFIWDDHGGFTDFVQIAIGTQEFNSGRGITSESGIIFTFER